MFVETAPEQVAELGPGKEGRRARVRGDKSLAVVSHKRQQIGLLLRRQIDLAHAEEEDRVEEIEIVREELFPCRDPSPCLERDRLFRNRLGICPDVRIESTRFAAKALDRRECMRNRFVLVPVADIGPREHVFARGGLLDRGSWGQSQCTRGRQRGECPVPHQCPARAGRPNAASSSTGARTASRAAEAE
jgi:hypothetical protein